MYHIESPVAADISNPMTPTAERIPYMAGGRILSMAAFLALPLSLFASKGMALLFGLAGLSCLIANLMHRKERLIIPGWSKLFAASLSIYAGISSIWSMTPGVSFRQAMVLGLVLFIGLLLVSTARRLEGASKHIFETGLIAGGVLGLAIVGIAVFFHGPLYSLILKVIGHPPEDAAFLLRTLNHGAAIAAIFMLPWVLVIRRRYGTVWAVISLFIGGGLLAFCEADSNKVALMCGLMAAFVVFLGGKTALKGFFILFIIGVLSAPWIITQLPDPLQPINRAAELPQSAQHRLLIWHTATGLILKRPLLGSGFDTARAFYGANQKVVSHFGGDKTNPKWSNLFEPIPLHPHNGILQVWLELGLVGALLFAGSLFLLMQRFCTINDRFERSMVFGSFVAGLTIFLVSYGAWQGWWLGSIWLMVTFAVASLADTATIQGRER